MIPMKQMFALLNVSVSQGSGNVYPDIILLTTPGCFSLFLSCVLFILWINKRKRFTRQLKMA